MQATYPIKQVTSPSGDLHALFAAREGMGEKERRSFEAVLLGALSCRISAAAWQEAIDAALVMNEDYRQPSWAEERAAVVAAFESKKIGGTQ